MMFPRRTFRDLRHSILLLVPLAAFAAVAGCATDKSPGGGSDAIVNHVTPSPVPGWLAVPSGGQHARSATLNYIANNGDSSCAECHGADLAGGISRVSCFGNPAGCHHDPVANWPSPAGHGATAKKAPGNSGFAACQICHGRDFSGGGANKSCFTCHATAPHAPKPWGSSGSYTHTNTDPLNAPVCASCHFPGSPNNPANHPATPAAAGTGPGCFNSTLCHGAGAAPHALGAGWRDPNSQFHGLTAKRDLSFCQGCHGTPGTTLFSGGAAPTSCQTSACHPEARAHPIRWYAAPQPFPGYVSSHRDSGNRAVACAICHKVDGAGTGPDPSAPSCFSATFNGVGCHSGGPGAASHAVPFPGTTHTAVTQAGFDSNCSVCHGVAAASPLSSAPPCTACHQAGSPLTRLGCTSCHGKPPSGTTYPNVAGKHARHDALADVTGVCTSCHNNLDSGSTGHYNRANARPGKDALRAPPGDAAFLAVYNAKAGAAAFDNAALTCANVSCHGGVEAPSWQTGSIDVNSDAGCRQCHKPGAAAGAPENNSPFSGLHAFHLDPGGPVRATCVECHDMANGTTGAGNHFRFLNTPQMEGPASQTVEPNGSAANYDAANQTCTVTCHAVQHTGFSWNGGASHPVPFTGANHTSVTSSTFGTNCGLCHFATGSTTKIGPTCTVCHKTGSPLTELNCSSCHADPPAGATYPNVDGKHAVHGALPGVAFCTPCHSGLESGTLAHYDRANALPGKDALRVPPGDVAFLGYDAKSGPASFNAAGRTCTNVICHGGEKTPDWQTSTANAIDVPNACLKCHASGTTQYNSYFSGKHDTHISKFKLNATTCKRCHDEAKVNVSGHFQNLATPAFEQPPPETILPAVGYNGTTCNPEAGGLTGCHGRENW